MTTIATRSLFIDTEVNQGGNGLSCRLSVPPSSFSVKPNQVIKLTLTNFEIRKNWYEVNASNNVFWIKVTFSGTSQYFPVVIPPGSYRAFGTTNTSTGVTYNTVYAYTNNDLCSAIAYAVNKTLSSLYTNNLIYDSTGGTNAVYTAVPGYTANAFFGSAPVVTVSFNTVTRKFTITFPTPSTNYSIDALVFLQCKSRPPSTHPMAANIVNFNNAYGDPTFQDSYELFGGIPTRDDAITNNTIAAGNAVTNNVYISPYVGQLNTMEAIYLRLMSASTNNFQSPGLDRNVQNNYALVPTNILARIPLPAAIYDDSIELLTYTEQGSQIFSCLIDARQIQTFEFSITDDKGRPIQEVLSGQAKSGDLAAKITIKYEVIQYDQSVSNIPASIDIIKSLVPYGFTRPTTDFNPPLTDKEPKALKRIPKASFRPQMGLLNQ